jgi:hypothetical protein
MCPPASNKPRFLCRRASSVALSPVTSLLVTERAVQSVPWLLKASALGVPDKKNRGTHPGAHNEFPETG